MKKKTVKQTEFFLKRAKRVIKLNGGMEIELPSKFYSVKDKREKRGVICLYYKGIEIASFGNGVTSLTIERYASEHEFNLREQKRKERKRKGKKMGGFMEAIEERNAKQVALKNKENKITFFVFDRKSKRNGRW